MKKLFFQNDKTFRPKKGFSKGSSQNQLLLHLTETLGSGNLKDAVRCPVGENLNEWLAVNAVDFHNQANVIYGNLIDFCTPVTCPIMSAGPKFDYLWADGEVVKKPIKCSAPEYVDYLMTWIQTVLEDDSVFPTRTDVPFPPKFVPTIKNIFKRLFRVYAHIYHNHFLKLQAMGAAAFLNTNFKHFILFTLEHNLVDRREMEPLESLITQLLSKDSSKSDQADLGHITPDFPSSGVRVAIIGTGWGANVQVPSFRKAGMEVIALWCRTDSKAQDLATQLGIPFATSDFDAILAQEDIDVISICTPPFLHKDLASKALRAGKSVICEKPMALNPEETKEMISVLGEVREREQKSGTKRCFAIIDHELRFLTTVRTMREMIKDGAIGEIMHIYAHITSGSMVHNKGWRWWSESSKGGGVLFAIGSHLIDLVTFVTGSKFVRVRGDLKTTISKREDALDKGTLKPVTSDDYCIVNFELDNGAFGAFYISFVTPGPKSHLIEISGLQGRLCIQDRSLVLYKQDRAANVTGSTGNVHGDGETICTDDREPSGKLASPWGMGTIQLAEAIVKQKADPANGGGAAALSHAATWLEGHRTQTVLAAVRKSSDSQGMWIDV